jgi:phosphopantetheinyl transferase
VTLLTAPLLLDAAGQVAGYWAADWLDRASVVFPVGFERLDVYAAAERAAGPVTGRLRVTELTESHLRADLDVVDRDARLLLRVRGWEDGRFDLPERFYAFRLDPKGTLASVPWDEPVARHPAADRLRCCRLEFPPGFLEADAGIWQEVLAHLTLSRREREAWRGLRHRGKRRSEWLLGRIAAKDAIRRLLKERAGLELYPADVEITVGELGQPRAADAWGARLGWTPAISIAHSDGVAVAVAGAGPGIRGVGVDIERITSRRTVLDAMAFTLGEQSLLAALPDRSANEWTLRCWCAKEATAKALGVGLAGGPSDLLVQDIDADCGEIALSISGRLARHVSAAFNGGPLVAHSDRNADFITAIAIHEGA